MAERRHKLDEEEIGNLVSGLIDAAVSFADSTLAAKRERATRYYRGDMSDLLAEEGRSSVVDHTVQDVIGWLLPGLMRIFFSADNVAVYEPKGREDVQSAKQATDYVNHIVLGESNAYQVFWDTFHDALLHGNGILKHFWDDTPDTMTKTLTGLSEDQFAQLTAADEVEVLEHQERIEFTEQAPVLDLVTGATMELEPLETVFHDVRISVEINKGNIKLAAVPPEHFLIDEDARDIDSARIVGERMRKTRSELIEMGFNRDDVEELAAGRSLSSEAVELARTDRGFTTGGGATGWDRATEEVEIFETYPLIDVDGDGIAERLKVISAGPSGGELLDWEIWEDDVPYSDLVPERVPHRWEGRSIFDDTEDIQRIKTVLMRGMLDNLYMSNVPDRAVDFNRVDNPDALFDRQIGNVIRTNGDPGNVIRDLTIPFTAQHSFAALEYCDQIIEKRTGVSRSAMGLDPETLQNQSATAANIQQSASYSKIELIARNFAELGLKRVFKCLLRLVVKHQDRPRTIRLRNEFVEYDPASWNAEMDATINVGLGSGSRDRDMMFLTMIQQKQVEAMGMVGGMRTAYGRKLAQAMLHTAGKTIEATGLKSPEMYFPEATEDELKEIAQATGQNPEMQKAQMQAAAEERKAERQAQIEAQKAAVKAASDEREAMIKREERLAEIDADMRTMLYRMDKEFELRLYQTDRELDLKARQLVDELGLKERLGMANAAAKANGANSGATSDVQLGGDPG